MHHRPVRHQRISPMEMRPGPKRHLGADRGNEWRVHAAGTMVVEAHDHPAESRIERQVAGLHRVEHQPPACAVGGGERRAPGHRIAGGPAFPRGELDRALDSLDLVRVGTVHRLSQKVLLLIGRPLPDDRCGAVRKGERPRKDLDHGAASRHPDHPGGAVRTTHVKVGRHAKLLVGVVADGAVDFVVSGAEVDAERRGVAGGEQPGLPLDPLPLHLEGMGDRAGVANVENHRSRSNLRHIECHAPLPELDHDAARGARSDGRGRPGQSRWRRCRVMGHRDGGHGGQQGKTNGECAGHA